MPRIRTIKPEFFTSDTVSSLPLRARLTWIGLWTHCDDYGRCRDNVRLIKAAVWPLDDVSLRDVAEDLDVLVGAGVIHRYVAGERAYIQVTGWTEHQKVDRPSNSAIPAPNPVDNGRSGSSTHTREPSVNTREPASSPRDGKGRERKGKEGDRARGRESEPSPSAGEPPPPRCPQHIDNPKPPPCGPCADARKARETWDTERDRRIRAAPKCRRHRGQPAENCALCRSEALGAEP